VLGQSLTFLQWMALTGALLLVMALSSAYLRRLPISTSAIYLAIGVAIGPSWLAWSKLDITEAAPWLERLTEVAVTVSLFIGGLKMRLPLRHDAWKAAYWLAGPLMLVSIGALALFGHLILGLDGALALLVAAILAPTDPVLAGAVSVNDAADKDRMRYGLSGEAGFNDGAAFPFVVLALEWQSGPLSAASLTSWGLHRLLWAVPAGLVLGFLLGRGVGELAVRVRSHHRDTNAPSDFLALALIFLSYVGAEALGAWGFLAVFAAGVGLRNAELSVVRENPHPEACGNDRRTHPPAEQLVQGRVTEEAAREPAVAAGRLVAETISFGDTVERLLEVFVVVLVGVALARYWTWRALPLAFALFFVVRPLATRVLLARTPTTRRQRWLMGWFGIRGVGSLYYLCYALSHGVRGADARMVASLVLSVVALSIVVHGLSAQPLLAYYERTLARVSKRRGLTVAPR